MAIPRLRLLDGCRSEPTASNGVVRSDPTSVSGLCRSRSVQPLGEFVEARLLCLRPAQGVPHLGVVLRWAPAPGGELFAVRASVDSDAETLWSLADHAPADRTLDARSHRVAVGRGRVNSLRRHFQILGLKSVFGLIERPAAVAPGGWPPLARGCAVRAIRGLPLACGCLQAVTARTSGKAHSESVSTHGACGAVRTGSSRLAWFPEMAAPVKPTGHPKNGWD